MIATVGPGLRIHALLGDSRRKGRWLAVSSANRRFDAS